MPESSLETALRKFESVEALLVKSEKLLVEIEAAGDRRKLYVGAQMEYDGKVREYRALIESLPPIDGWKLETSKLSAFEVTCSSILDQGEAPTTSAANRLLREFRDRFDAKRRELIRGSLIELIESVDSKVGKFSPIVESIEKTNRSKKVDDPDFEVLRTDIAQIDTLIGSSVTRPPRWSDLRRHLSFGEYGDLVDIVYWDWPEAKEGICEAFEIKPSSLGMDAIDLGSLVRERPSGTVSTKLHWDRLTPEEFERLVYSLFIDEATYENPKLDTRTNASDRGRDVSAHWAYTDPLMGTMRKRLIVQCKHWLAKSIGVAEMSALLEQMKLWEPPRVDILIVATSGRFSGDAVAYVEKHNQRDSSLAIEIWPESYLEVILSRKPHLIAEFSLR